VAILVRMVPTGTGKQATTRARADTPHLRAFSAHHWQEKTRASRIIAYTTLYNGVNSGICRGGGVAYLCVLLPLTDPGVRILDA